MEEKCEEYLTQLQRSAELIEANRANHQDVVESLESRIDSLQSAVHELEDRLQRSHDDNQRLTQDNSELLSIAKQESKDHDRSKIALQEKDAALQDMSRKYR